MQPVSMMEAKTPSGRRGAKAPVQEPQCGHMRSQGRGFQNHMPSPVTIRGRTIFASSPDDIAYPPIDTLEPCSLFLDLDGTLIDLADRPDDVVAGPALHILLLQLSEKLGGRLAIVSGRSVAQIDDILGDVAHKIAIAGSHGVEHRWPGMTAQPVRPVTLDEAATQFQSFAAHREGVLVEDKSFGVALHYRLHPQAEEEAQHLAQDLAQRLGLQYQPGKMMAELRVTGGNKGSAVHMMMARAEMSHTHPVFVGDDDTDEAGFIAAREYGGAGVLVGKPRATAALYRLPDPAAVHNWLKGFLA